MNIFNKKSLSFINISHGFEPIYTIKSRTEVNLDNLKIRLITD